MRGKLLSAQPPSSARDVRRIEGGIMDIDLLTAMLQLHLTPKPSLNCAAVMRHWI